MRTQEFEVSFMSDRIIIFKEFSTIILISLIPWVRITVDIIKEFIRVDIGSLLLSAIRRANIVYHKEVLIVAAFAIIGNLRGDFIACLIIIVNDKSRHIIPLTTSHKIHTLTILWISHPFPILQSIGKFIVMSDILQFFWCWILMKTLWSMQMTVIDFNHSLSRINKRRVEIILLIRLPIDDDRQFNVNIPESGAEQLSGWVVERRRLSVVTKLTFCSVK